MIAGVAAAAAILISAARDSVLPSPQPTTTSAPTTPAEYGVVARTPDDPANPPPWTPDGR